MEHLVPSPQRYIAITQWINSGRIDTRRKGADEMGVELSDGA